MFEGSSGVLPVNPSKDGVGGTLSCSRSPVGYSQWTPQRMGQGAHYHVRGVQLSTPSGPFKGWGRGIIYIFKNATDGISLLVTAMIQIAHKQLQQYIVRLINCLSRYFLMTNNFTSPKSLSILPKIT